MAIVKAVSFKEKEQDLVNFIRDRDFSYYVKDLIRKDKNKEEKVNDQKVNEQKPVTRKRNVNFDM